MCFCVCTCLTFREIELSCSAQCAGHLSLLKVLVFVCVCVCAGKLSHTSEIKTSLSLNQSCHYRKKNNPSSNKLFRLLSAVASVHISVYKAICAYWSVCVVHACACVFCGCLCIQVCVFALADGVNPCTQSVKPLS